MKKTLCLTCIVFSLSIFSSVPSCFAQDVSPEFVVRLIYFLPNDRQPAPNIDADFDIVMKEVQQYYGDMMEYHGFDRKTFRLETDAAGKVVVYHVNGDNNVEYYRNHINADIDQVRGVFDFSRNVYIIASDIFDKDHTPVRAARTSSENTGGMIWLPSYTVSLRNHEYIIHQLGLSFGLQHDDDNRTGAIYFPGTGSIGSVKMSTSFCSAEWFNANRYFNTNQNIINDNTSVEMLTPSLEARPDVIRFPFKITDPDGLYQVQFVSPVSSISLIGCMKLKGKSTTVDLVTPKLIDTEFVLLQVMDIHGNWQQHSIRIDINTLPLPPPEVISVPDQNLASAIRETLELSPEDDITQLDMVRLKRFTATNRQIRDLTGLEHAIRINWLYLSKNQISDITPISNLTNLRHLGLGNNQISDIHLLTGLTNLRHLGLGNNQISDLNPLIRLTNLTDLHLDTNSINGISPLIGLTNLTDLGLANNQISDISPLVGLTDLTKLQLGHNQIIDINPLIRLTNLKDLHLGVNQIKSLSPLTRLTNLELLYLYDNQISDIRPLAGLTSLRALFISRNQIRDITPLSRLIHLRDLQLDENQISDIRSLRGLTNLRLLWLQENTISDVNSLEGLINLRVLIIWKNPIKDRTPLLALLRKTPDIEIRIKYGGEPLPVTLSHFRAEYTNTGVVIKWTTEAEVDNAGFYIYRGKTRDGEFKVVNSELIQGAGTTGERNEYTWTDTTAKPNTVYYYCIEDVSYAGNREQLATVRLRGLVSARSKWTLLWVDLKISE